MFNACFIPAIYFFCKFDQRQPKMRGSHLHETQIPRLAISHSKKSTACSQARKLLCTSQTPKSIWRRCAHLRSRRLMCRESTQLSVLRSNLLRRQFSAIIFSSFRNDIVMEEAAIPIAPKFKLRSRVSRTAKKHGEASGYNCLKKQPFRPEIHLRRSIISNMLGSLAVSYLGFVVHFQQVWFLLPT